MGKANICKWLFFVPASVFAGWEKQTSVNEDISLIGIWGSSKEDVFAVGYTSNNGAIVHYNGRSWKEMNCQFCGDWYDFRAVWGSSKKDVFAVGISNNIFHFNGVYWSKMDNEFSGIEYMALNDIWGSSKNDIFAVGSYGNIFHYNGIKWSGMDDGLSAIVENSLHGVWGSSPNDVFAVGENGIILHYDGNSWSKMNSGITSRLDAIWGSSKENVFAVGRYGAILHYDGRSWTGNPITTTSIPSSTTSIVGSYIPTENWLMDIWGSSENNIFTVGVNGTILHFNGSTWSKMENDIAHGLTGIWGISAKDIYAIGGNNIYHYNGLSSKIIGEYICAGNPCTTDPCLPGVVWAVATDDEIYYLKENGSWISGCAKHSWNGYTPKEGKTVVVRGEVSERTDVFGSTYYNIEVKSIYPKICPIELLYGEHSKETKILRYFRDHILKETPTGQELIRLYYELNPSILKAIEQDEEFKQDVREMIDGVLELLGEEAE